MTTTAPTLIEIPITSVYPDPFQPRIHADTELADSLKSVGQLQPIRVELAEPLDAIDERTGKTFTQIAAESGYMIQDGERRWRGSLEAGKRTILAVVVPHASEGTRLVRQLVANTGKPLTPIEEARAYKRLMDLEGWGVNRLAQELGRPRSTIGDRVRALELDPVWLSLMDDGVLQISHAAVLHPYAAVPHDYQVKAAAKLGDGWRVKQALVKREPVSVEDLSHDLFGCYRDYVVKLADVRGYKGPVIEVKRQEWGGKEKFAADPAIWRPIYKRFQKAQKAKRASGSGGSQMRSSRASWANSLPDGVQERSSSEYYPQPNQGEIQLLDGNGWELGAGSFDTRHVLANIQPSQLIKVVGKYSVALMTTDVAGVEAARAAFNDRVDETFKKKARSARERLEASLVTYEITGAGVQPLAAWLLSADREDGGAAPADVAAALELADPELLAATQPYRPGHDDIALLVVDMAARQTLEAFCSAVAATAFLDIKLPSYDSIRDELARGMRAVNPKWPGAKGEKKAKKSAAKPRLYGSWKVSRGARRGRGG
jgi:ParB/RepB/Spo0J family partition protein